MKQKKKSNWKDLANKAYEEIEDWRAKNPTATFDQIEQVVDEALTDLFALMLEEVALESAAADIKASQEEEGIKCSTCGEHLCDRGKHFRSVVTNGNKPVCLERSYGYCPTCKVGFFPLDEQLG